MKTRILLVITMIMVLVMAGLPNKPAIAVDDPLALPATPTTTLSVTVDGVPLTVYHYKVVYVANPVPVFTGGVNTLDYESMNIYVPATATENSPIILQDNNGGWKGGRAGTSVTNGANYNSVTNKVGVALKAGYVIANVGCRSRGMQDEAGNFIGHAPIQVVDIKAAIRYLRYNDAAMPGDTDRIVITGTSGGGGLGVAVAASGNSPEYYPYLYAIGAAGVTYDAASGAYSSTINDDLFGTVLYCPITDLDNADAAYEWQYNTTRWQLGIYSPEQMAASDWLKENYVPYFNQLGLRDEDNKRLVTDELDDAITALVEKEIEEAYIEVGPTQMAADIAALPYPDNSWYSIDAAGNATLYLDKYLYFIVKNQALKTPPAFDNYKSTLQGAMNESNLAGTATQEYSAFTEWAWNNNAIPGDGIGWEDVGLPWRGYIQTDAGQAVVKQMEMIDPMPYLVSDTNGDNAPYWYYRHGMRDRDTAFAVEVAMYYAVLNASGVHNTNFEIAWLKPHGGDYDVPEAYEWVSEAVDNANTFSFVDALIGDVVTENFYLPTGLGITYTSSDESVVNVMADGTVVVSRPAKKDATVTLTVSVVSDQLAGNNYNYGVVDVTHDFTFVVPATGKN
jgi:acetyl esterase/lipase